ncbi:hypothetical protein CHC183_10320 [Helicobacter pylori]
MKRILVSLVVLSHSAHAVKTHNLERVEASGVANDKEAPLSWRSKEVRNYMGSRTVISNKQLTKSANQSIEEALQNVPGVHIRNSTGMELCLAFPLGGLVREAQGILIRE